MEIQAPSITRYEQRCLTVRDIVKQHSTLNDEAALELAKHMLHALDTIPERMR